MKKKAPTIASIASTPSVMPTPKPAFAPEDKPDDSGDPVALGLAIEEAPVWVAEVVTELDVEVDVAEPLADIIEVLTRGRAATAVVHTSGSLALNTRSLSLQQLVLRPVTPASRVPCGVQQNSFLGSKQ